jgi:NADH-quinone oxidoreductase subunit L
VPEFFARTFRPIYVLLENKYYFDRFNEVVFAGGARLLGRFLWQIGDRTIIDGAVVNGSASMVGELAAAARTLQSGRLYHYAFAMLVGMVVLLWFIYGGH